MKKTLIPIFFLACSVISLPADDGGPIVGFKAAGGGGGIVYPLPDWQTHLFMGFGGEASVELSILPEAFDENLYMSADLGFAYFLPVSGGYLSFFSDGWAQIGAGYSFTIDGIGLSIAPEVGYGVLLHIVDGTISGNQSFGVFADQHNFVSVKISYEILPFLSVYIQPQYRIFYEASSIGHQLIGFLGLDYK